MYLSLHQDSGIQNLIKSSDNETYTSHHDCKFIVIGIPAITQSDPVPKKMVISMCFTKNVQITGRSVTYFKRNKRMDVWKTDGKGYTVSQWCMAHGRNQRKPEIARGIRNE